MNAIKMEYKMDKFNEENVELLLKNLGFDSNNYLIAMTKPSVLSMALVGIITEFSNRYSIICFGEAELNLIMLSRIDSTKVTELIKINCNEINKMKLTNILISYMLDIKTNDSNLKFQVFKKVAKFTKLKNSMEILKKTFNI